MVTHKSRTLEKAEQNYGKIEGESLGVLWGVKIKVYDVFKWYEI